MVEGTLPLQPKPQDRKAGLLMDLLAQELEAHLCVEGSAQEVPLEHLDLELSS